MTSQRGFTLIELAIVLVILTILIGGLAVPLSAQIQARRVAETRADMRAIEEALIGFALRQPNAHLPCPDDGNGNEGARDGAGQCQQIKGGLPWRALGLEGSDAWGNRYTYAVSKLFTDDDDGFSPATAGDLKVNSIYSNCSGTILLEGAVVVVSHGPNGRGAQNKNGGTPLAPGNVPFDERQNLPSGNSGACSDKNFVSKAPSQDFDDLVIWLHPNAIISRVCPLGACP
jgi:prepilin-type N-terminal cleavage/methylation domain-containing protein